MLLILLPCMHLHASAGAQTDAAVAACRRSDACLFFVGTTAVWGMQQEAARFGSLPLLSPVVEAEGWDRKDLTLPGRQLNLIQVWLLGVATLALAVPMAAVHVAITTYVLAVCRPWPSAAAPPSSWCCCMAGRWMWSGCSTACGCPPSSRPGGPGRCVPEGALPAFSSPLLKLYIPIMFTSHAGCGSHCGHAVW